MITIIILLILTGITISQLTGSGLFENSKLAKEKYENAVKEEEKLQEIYSKLLLANTDGTSLGNIDMVTLKKLILDTTYPVGSLFFTIDGTNPAITLGGEWEQISQGRTLFGAGTLNDIAYTADTNIDAGLPEISGTFRAYAYNIGVTGRCFY